MAKQGKGRKATGAAAPRGMASVAMFSGPMPGHGQHATRWLCFAASGALLPLVVLRNTTVATPVPAAALPAGHTTALYSVPKGQQPATWLPAAGNKPLATYKGPGQAHKACAVGKYVAAPRSAPRSL